MSFQSAIRACGFDVIWEAAQKGFVVVSLEEFVEVHREAESAIWSLLKQQGISDSIGGAPMQLWRRCWMGERPKQHDQSAAPQSRPPQPAQSDSSQVKGADQREETPLDETALESFRQKWTT